MSLGVSYHECLETMYGLRRFGIKLGLDTISALLSRLGSPQQYFACVHVAGSNGKGSIASSLAAVLKAAGFRVGLFTSPHLVRFNERICINGEPISDQQVVEACQTVLQAHQEGRQPTFFEFATAMALYEFKRCGVDWAVVETGMGGRLDATNVIIPKVSIISNISLEHRTYLGNTIAKIAFEKGGIIKPNVPVVTGVRQKSAISVLSELANGMASPFYRLGADFSVRRKEGNGFSYRGISNVWHHLNTSLVGQHQVENAALVLAVCELLMQQGTPLEIAHIRNGLENATWPGRLEYVDHQPPILLDGAHNQAAAANLAKYLKRNLNGKRITLVIGILDDKPYAHMLRSLVPCCDRVIVTQATIDRALPPEMLRNEALKFSAEVRMVETVEQALREAIAETDPEDVICVAGSLYVVGEAKAILNKAQSTV